ncbi:MAG: hypothetical protein SGBAC_013220 [Bacillariaceae sp.]
MPFLLQCDDGLDLENYYEASDDIMGYVSSSNYESSDADDCYIEALKTEPAINENSGTTITKLKKDGSLSSFEAPLSPPRPRSRAAVIASAPSSAAPSSVVGQQQQRRKRKKKMKKKTKKAVQFSNADEYCGILSLKDFTKKERKNCWYTKADLIKRDACLDWFAQQIEAKTEPKGDETFRGLEDLDVEQREKSEERRIAVIEAVLNAQDEHEEEQVEFGVVEPVFLAVASMEMSQDSKTDALEVGMMDMLEVLPFTFEPKNPRRSLPAGLEVGTIVDPYPVPDRPRRYSAPAESIKDNNTTHSNEEMMKALALFDEIDISSPLPPPALEVPAEFRTPETTTTKKRRSSGRHSLDSSTKHDKSKLSKSKSRSDSSSVSLRKIKKSIIVKKTSVVGPPPPSPHMQSPVKKKAKASITNSNSISNQHLPSAVPSPKKKKDDSKSSRPRSRSPSSNKPPFSVTSAAASANAPSVSAAKVTPPMPFAIKKKPTNKSATATPFSSPMMQIPERSTFENGPASHLTSKRISSHLMMTTSRKSSNEIRHISAPTPPRKDPPGMFQRISSIRLEDNYPPSVPRL